jgi:hypothetical protein
MAALVRRAATMADSVVRETEKPKPKLSKVAGRAADLTGILISLSSAIEREPNQAAAHMDTLKGIAQDIFSLGAALMSAATVL